MTVEAGVERNVDPTQAAVVDELSRLLGTRRFSGSPQMSAFLEYVVTQTLAGNAKRIKAYTIGVDALGKPDTFDAQEDPSVRVLALRLRKALTKIYETPGTFDVIIEFKPGSYVPIFRIPTLESTRTGPIPVHLVSGETSANHVLNESTPTLLSSNGDERTLDVSDLRDEFGQNTLGTAPLRKLGVASRKGSLVAQTTLAVLIVSAVTYFALSDNSDSPKLSAQLADGRANDVPVHLMSMPGPSSVEKVQFSSTPSLSTPSVLLPSNRFASEHLQRLSQLLSNSLAEAGVFDVIQADRPGAVSNVENVSYAFLFNEISVGFRPRIDLQIIRVGTGSVVMSETLIFGQHETVLSAGEVHRIEKLAHAISDPAGPVSQDYVRLAQL